MTLPLGRPRSRETLLSFAGVNLLLLAGCSAGPVHVRIETAGQRQGDFVVHPATRHGRIEGSSLNWLAPRVVSSEEDLVLPRFSGGPSVSTYELWVYHPEFATEWTAHEPGGEVRLPPVRPRRWDDILAEEAPLTFSRVSQHLLQMQEGWAPAFAPEQRVRLQAYLPGLRTLAEGARMGSGDWSRFESEEAARGQLERQLASIAGMMQ